ncbi:MAG: ImmA/IrrE family metallo-endopeptidase [Bacteroidia bacterium]
MRNASQIERELLSPPGDTIQETIDVLGMSQAELAERMGRPKEKVNDIIKGREPVSTATAFQLEKVLGIPAGFWINREKEYRKALYEIEQKESYIQNNAWLQNFPVTQMKKLGWLPQATEKHILVDAILSFFGVASPEEWKRIYVDEEVSVAFRISLAHTQNPYAISAWLRMGELEAQKLNLALYNKKLFKESLEKVKQLAFEFPEDFAAKLQTICATAGVAVVYTPNLPKAPVSGASRWFHNRPLIQLSGRYKTDDHFWFTFFHEAGHILEHGKKDIFLENVAGTETDLKKEEEADRFAAKCLLKESEWTEILENAPYTESQLITFAQKFKTPVSAIIGRLQHQGLIAHSSGNHLRRKIELFG